MFDLEKDMKKKLWFCFLVIALCFAAVACMSPEQENHIYGEEIPLGKTDKGYVYVKTCEECGEETEVIYDALLTFVDDDAKMQAMVHWERILDETGIEMTAALIPGKIEETTDYDCWWAYAGWDLLERVQEKGVDFVNHTYSHINLKKLTPEEIREDLQKGKDALKDRGIESEILVYPNNAYNEEIMAIVDDYFDAAFACRNKVVTDSTVNRHALTRIDINDKNVKKVIEFDAERIVECYGIKPVKTLKRELNKAVRSEGWLVYMVHAYDSPGGQYFFDETSEQTIIDFCRFVQEQGRVKIVTLTEGLAASAPRE